MLEAVEGNIHQRLCALLEEGRRAGTFDFGETRITAQAACSLPGFLYNWYQPGGKLGPAEMVVELTDLASRVLGLRNPAPAPAPVPASAPAPRKRASRTASPPQPQLQPLIGPGFSHQAP